MNNHKGKRLYITGIPTAGKSYLAQKLAEQVGGIVVKLDDYREVMAKDERFEKWVSLYWNIDEKHYYASTTPEQRWQELVDQSEALFPGFLEKINSYVNETKPVIFECVNLLPHLGQQLGFPGIVIVGNSYEETLQRNIQSPRWGSTLELQELEAKEFFFEQRPNYSSEAKQYTIQIFNNADEAYETALNILKK